MQVIIARAAQQRPLFTASHLLCRQSHDHTSALFACTAAKAHLPSAPSPPPATSAGCLAARAQFKDTLARDGWSHLDVVSFSQCSDDMQAFAAGFAEGFVTAALTAAHARNIVAEWRSAEDDRSFPTASVTQWLMHNVDYMALRSQMRVYDAFWRQVGLVLQQLHGVVAGAAAGGHSVTLLSLLLSNYDAELFDIIDAINREDRES
jgi:hypothetical protein